VAARGRPVDNFRHVHGRTGAAGGSDDGGQPDSVRRHHDHRHEHRIRTQDQTPVAGRVERPAVGRRCPGRPRRRAGRGQPFGRRLRAVPVRVPVRHQTVREPGGRRAVCRVRADRTTCHRGHGRIRVPDARRVRAGGRLQGATADAPTDAVHVADGRPGRTGLADRGQAVGRDPREPRPGIMTCVQSEPTDW